MKNNFKTLQNKWLKVIAKSKNILSSPNRIIIPASISVSLLLLYIASVVEQGIWYDFTVNMSASMLIIGITVLLVDLLRESHKSRLYKAPKYIALNKVVGCNAVLALTLAVYNRHDHVTIIQKLVNHARSEDSGSFVNDGTSEAIKSLANINTDKIVSGCSDDKLTGELKNTLTSISVSYTEVSSNYGFSFNDINLRADFAELTDSLNAAIQTMSVIDSGLTDQEMAKMFRPVDPKNPGSPMTKNWFVGVMLQKYLVTYTKFIKKHVEHS